MRMTRDFPTVQSLCPGFARGERAYNYTTPKKGICLPVSFSSPITIHPNCYYGKAAGISPVMRLYEVPQEVEHQRSTS